jgi:hypothetical protein
LVSCSHCPFLSVLSQVSCPSFFSRLSYLRSCLGCPVMAVQGCPNIGDQKLKKYKTTEEKITFLVLKIQYM